MTNDGYSIQPLTADTWDAFAGLVERHNGIFGGCWCTYFHPECVEREPGYEGSRALKKRLVEAGQAHAALVMIGTEAIAWAEFGTPEELQWWVRTSGPTTISRRPTGSSEPGWTSRVSP